MYDHLVERARGALSSLTLRRAVLLIVATATVLALTAALLVWMIDPAIDTFGDALWWAVSTVTTVGYGDVLPESSAGRVVAAALMLTGLGLIPVITSVVVSILVSQRTREAQEDERRQLDQLFERLDQLERRLLDERR